MVVIRDCTLQERLARQAEGQTKEKDRSPLMVVHTGWCAQVLRWRGPPGRSTTEALGCYERWNDTGRLL